MIDSDKGQFKILMIGAGETYGKEITKPLLQIYFQSLQQHSIDDVSAAFSKHLIDAKHGTFFPKPADIIRHLTANDVTSEDKAELAWMTIMGEIRRTGSYGTLKIDDKQAIAALKNIGGWLNLCQTMENQLQWKHKEFLEAYATFERTPLEMLPTSLPGLEELDQHKNEAKKGLSNLQAGLEAFEAKRDI